MTNHQMLPRNLNAPLTGPPVQSDHAVCPPIGNPVVLAFNDSGRDVAESDRGVLRRWVERRMRRDPDTLVLIGSPTPGSRSARVMRLRGLRDLIASFGIAGERVRYTGDVVGALPTSRAGEPGPAIRPTAVVIAVSSEGADCSMTPIRSLFGAFNQPREAPCTSAS